MPTGFASPGEDFIPHVVETEQGRSFGYVYPAEFVPVRRAYMGRTGHDVHVVPNPKGGWDVVRGKEVVGHAPPSSRKGGRRRPSGRKSK